MGLLELQQLEHSDSLGSLPSTADSDKSSSATNAPLEEHHLQQHQQQYRVNTLPCLNERMSDESLDDVHAFTDLRNVVKQIKIPSDNSSSGAGSGGSGSNTRSREGSLAGSILGDSNFLLETLEEFDGENEDENESEEGGEEIVEKGKDKRSVSTKGKKNGNESEVEAELKGKIATMTIKEEH